MSQKPLTTEQLKTYKERMDIGGLPEARQVYAELYAQGYNYAGWAAGVANGTSTTGVSALEFLKGTALMGIGSDACKNLSGTQIDNIRVSMGKGYVDTLIDISKRSGDVLTRDVDFKETKTFHEASMRDNGLSLDNWTLNTPMELLRQTKGDAAVEATWQSMRDTGGSGPGALIESSKLAYTVGQLAFSDDPAVKAQALAWMDQTPGFANPEQMVKAAGAVVNAYLNSLPSSTDYSDPMGTGDGAAVVGAAGGVDTTNTTSGGGTTYNFPDTAGAGRGSVNPDTVASTAPATPVTPTAFNPATSLADYHGDASHSYTVQKGDTVGSIAIKLGMTPVELGDYLKEQYGADANLNSIVAGRSLPVPADKLAAYKEASINGLDLPAEPLSTTPTTLKPDLTDEQASAIQQDLGLPSNGPKQPGLQLAAATPTDPITGNPIVSDAGGGGTPHGSPASEQNKPTAPAEPAQEAINVVATPVAPEPNPNNFSAYLGGPGASLTTAQQDTLATQLDGLGLGGDADLSFYALPDGGVLIGNADGDIVGEINHSASGDLNLRANSVNTDGSAGTLSTHISEEGSTLSDSQYSQYQASQLSAGLGLVNSLNNLQSWDHMSDLGKLNATVGLYNQIDGLGNAYGGDGNNLPGDLGAAAGWLSLAQGIESGDSLIIANGLNSVSNGAIDGAINNALGSEGVPYLGYVLALRNFADDPEQAVGTMVGTYVGEIVGGYFGPIGAVIGADTVRECRIFDSCLHTFNAAYRPISYESANDSAWRLCA